jgi:hypothetical protein
MFYTLPYVQMRAHMIAECTEQFTAWPHTHLMILIN